MGVRRRELARLGLGALTATALPARWGRAAVEHGALLELPLRARVGQSLAMTLALPSGEGFATANVGRLFARTATLQRNIPITGLDRITHTLDAAGPTLIVVCAGPAADRDRPDAWARATHSCKAFVRVSGAGAATAVDPGSTAKVGLPIELMPLVAPFRLRVGSDLPVRAYFHNGKQAGALILGHRPDNSVLRVTTDAVGTAALRIDQPGRWLVRFGKRSVGRDHVAQLCFEVPGAGAQG